MINFHCVLNEMSGAMPDPVSAVAEQQNQNQSDDSIPIMYLDPSEFDDIDDINGQPKARVRRPSRSQ